RRHTRFSRDWSSDVCSSDLVVDKDFGFEIGGIANNVRDAIEFAFEEFQRLRSNIAPVVVVIDVKVLATKVLPIELTVLDAVFPERLVGLLCQPFKRYPG